MLSWLYLTSILNLVVSAMIRRKLLTLCSVLCGGVVALGCETPPGATTDSGAEAFDAGRDAHGTVDALSAVDAARADAFVVVVPDDAR